MEKPPEPMKIKGQVKTEDQWEEHYDVVNDKISKTKHKMDENFVDIRKIERKIKKNLTSNGIAEGSGKNFQVKIPKNVQDEVIPIYQDMTKKFGNNIVMEFSDNGFRVKRTKSHINEPILELQDLAVCKRKRGTNKFFLETADNGVMETADDDRVIGIPYTIANVGADKYYVINGRVYSGWSMWYGLQAIRSPEDYARNVDLTYNVPYVWGGFNLKAQLSLGADFDIVHGTEEEETPEENFVKEVFKTKLRINVQKLQKTAFHLDMYGNAYWHIRRDNRGIPDKVTILQPERMKVFLDPKTTKVLYYIYLPPILAGMALTPYPNIRENPNIMHGPALTYPTPIVIDPHNIIHFKENAYTEYPYGLSTCKAMLDPCTARMDINVIAPMIFKKYAKPLIHWRMDPMNPFQLTKGQIENYISGFKDSLENMEPMSDPITSTRWSAAPIGAAQGKAELLTILQDLDNQIFSTIGVPESYFKPQGMSDRMIAEQDKTMLAAGQLRQKMVGEDIERMLIKPIVDMYDRMINEQMVAQGMEPLPERPWNAYPELEWRETFKQDQVTTIQNTLALLQAGIIDKGRAARRVGEMAPAMSVELTRQADLAKISEEVQIKQAELQMMQTELEQMQTMAIIENGGVDPALEAEQEAAAAAEGGDGGSTKKRKSDDDKTQSQKDSEKYDENKRYKVTFTNRTGKNQTEVMKGSTLKERRSSGLIIKQVTPVSNEMENPAQEAAGKAIGK